MIEDGDFKIEKGYFAVNKTTDMSKITKIYNSFSEKPNINRFRDYLLVCELEEDVHRDTSIFRTKLKERYKEKIIYDIEYTNLKKKDKFIFCVSITIPKEFNKHTEDFMEIAYDYGIYEFVSKIDKQNRNAKYFSPTCQYNKKKTPPSSFSNIYYKGFKWKFRNPTKEGKIILKFD